MSDTKPRSASPQHSLPNHQKQNFCTILFTRTNCGPRSGLARPAVNPGLLCLHGLREVLIGHVAKASAPYRMTGLAHGPDRDLDALPLLIITGPLSMPTGRLATCAAEDLRGTVFGLLSTSCTTCVTDLLVQLTFAGATHRTGATHD